MKKYLFLSVFLGLLIPSLSFASFNSNLKYGSNGPEVRELQEFLTDEGVYTGPITGRFLSLTRKAVVAFQAKYALRADGFFGPMSRAQANAILATADANSDAQEVAETGSVSAPQNNSEFESLLKKMQDLLASNEALKSKVTEQQTTLEKIQQNSAQIVQNTAPTVVEEKPKVIENIAGYWESRYTKIWITVKIKNSSSENAYLKGFNYQLSPSPDYQYNQSRTSGMYVIIDGIMQPQKVNLTIDGATGNYFLSNQYVIEPGATMSIGLRLDDLFPSAIIQPIVDGFTTSQITVSR